MRWYRYVVGWSRRDQADTAGAVRRIAWSSGACARARGLRDFYARALRRLARRGLRPAPHETAREFCARVGAEAPALTAPLAELTVAYEATRFGGQSLTPHGSRTLRELARDL
jgi:hypothetical protein